MATWCKPAGAACKLPVLPKEAEAAAATPTSGQGDRIWGFRCFAGPNSRSAPPDPCKNLDRWTLDPGPVISPVTREVKGRKERK